MNVLRVAVTVTTGPRMVLRSTIECRDCGGHDIDTDSGA